MQKQSITFAFLSHLPTAFILVTSALLSGCNYEPTSDTSPLNNMGVESEIQTASEAESDTDNMAVSERISSGKLTTDYPSVGYLSSRAGSGQYCSATLIGPRTVLTAAHCIEGTNSGWFSNDFFTSRWNRAIPHPNYRRDSDYDIALVILDNPITSITPAWLYTGRPQAGQQIVLIGYGYSSNNTSDWEINEKYLGNNRINGVDPLWFDYRGQSNNCSGDSGGPSFYNGQLIGVHAWGDGNRACSATTGWDVRVDIYLDWIRNNAVDPINTSTEGGSGNSGNNTDSENQATITITNPEITVGSPIRIAFANLPRNADDWIGLYQSNDGHQQFLTWQYTEGRASGTMTFNTPLEVGQYEARLFFNDSYQLEDTVSFTIVSESDTTNEESGNGEENGNSDSSSMSNFAVKKAEFKSDKSELKVEIIADQPNLALEIVNFGTMEYKFKNGEHLYKLKVKNTNNPGNQVTLRNAGGATRTIPLTQR